MPARGPLPDAARGRDVLRVEHFGAIHYARRGATFEVFPPAFAALLEGATERHIMDVWRDDPRGISLSELVGEVARLMDAGILVEYRCPARVVSDPQPASLSAPLVTNVQLTRACNLTCEHCFVEIDTQRHPRELSLEQLESLFAELALAGAPLVILAGGEPMTRPDFWPIVEAVERWDLDAALCTNATMIKEPQALRLAATSLKWISVSLDGPDEAIHDAIRGRGSFVRAVRGIRTLVAAGAKGVKLRVTVTTPNAPYLASFSKIATELAVPEIVFKPFRHGVGGSARTSTHLYISRAEYLRAVERAQAEWPAEAPPATFDDGMPESLPAWTNVTPAFGCVGGTTHASVTFEGRIIACDAVFDDADWTFHERGLIEAWRGSPTIRAWRHLEDGGSCRSCGNFERCGGGCRVRALSAGLTIHDPDPWAYCETGPRSPLLRIFH
ncbi:MAG: radical SAM protein [Deltaproteobacteria bacterium]|nr:radical SAM protein [Deltaproteobacteria bacterium]